MTGGDHLLVNEIEARLTAFIRNQLVPDCEEEIDETTPLLGLGVLDSLKTAILLNFIRDELGAEVPLAQINARSFHSVRSISTVVGAANGANTLRKDS
jgi:clorobiocin biosynthesis protein CloN5